MNMQSGGLPVTTAAAGTTSAAASNVPPRPGGTPNPPLRAGHPTSYHVPRGAAAVANIAMPRSSSLASPIVRSGVAGNIVSIRSTGRAPSPSPNQPRPRPPNISSLPVSRPPTPQRGDAPRPPTLHATSDKPLVKSTVSGAQVQARVTSISSTTQRITTPSQLSSPSIPPTVQLVGQSTTQTTQPSVQLVTSQSSTVTAPLSVSQSSSQIASSATAAARNRPVSQATQAGAPGSLPVSASAVVLTAPARLASPGLLGVTTGTTRLAVATALPASGARLVTPQTRLPQARTVTYTSSQVLQAARLPSAPVRISAAGRSGMVSVHPVMGVAPLKPAPPSQGTGASSGQPAAGAQPSSQISGQTASQPSSQLQPATTSAAPLPTLQPAPLRALSNQGKGMTPNVVTVAAVSGPLRSVVATVTPGSNTAPALTPTSALSPAPSVTTAAPASKSGFAQTLTTVAARPLAVGAPPVRPGQTQPSVYIHAQRASPGPSGQEARTYTLPTTYCYDSSGGYQVANVTGRSYTGAPYIVQTTRSGSNATQVHAGLVSGNAPGALSSSTTSGATASSVVSSASSSGSTPMTETDILATGVPAGVSSVVSNASAGQSVRFNSVMVVDPSRTSLPIHAAYVPSEGPAAATFIATDGTVLTAQPAPQTIAVSSGGSQPSIVTPATLALARAYGQDSGQPHSQPPQATPVLTSASNAPIPLPVVVTQSPMHIQLQQTNTTQQQIQIQSQVQQSQQQIPQPLSAQILVQSQSAQSQSQAPTAKQNASPRPSILRKRDNEGSPMKAQKNLTPMLVSMSTTAASATTGPPSPPSPPKRPESGGPASSGSTTISATSSPGQESPPPVPQAPPSAASIAAGLHAAGLHSGPTGTEMSPRKKPRKQQLTGNELQEHKMSEDEIEFLIEEKEVEMQQNLQHRLQQQQMGHPQQLQQIPQQPPLQPHPAPAPAREILKKPNISLLSTYRYSWKSRHNHFLRPSDVRPKDERRPTVNELASQKYIVQRLNGWKVHHLTTQMEDLADIESQVCQQLESMLGVMDGKAEQDEDRDVNRVNELIKGNMQRSRVIADQLLEAKSTVMKIFDHKRHVQDIINRSVGKRTMKKRDKS